MVSFRTKCQVKGICFCRHVYMCAQAFFWCWFAPFLPVTDSVRQELLDISTLPVCQKDVTGGMGPHFD